MIAPDDPRHGTRAGYLAGCHEETCCKRACRIDMKARQLRVMREGPLKVDPEPVRELAEYWAARGLSYTALAAAAGVSSDSVKRSVGNRLLKIRLTTLNKILAITEDDLLDTSYIYAALTKARVASLMADGQKLKDIVPLVGLPMEGNWRKYPRVSVRVARAVRDLYRQSPGYGPAIGTASRARNRGSIPSMAWDDPGTLAEPVDWRPTQGATDAPALLDETAVLRRMSGEKVNGEWVRLHGVAESVEAVRRLRFEHGMSLRDIERFTGLNANRYNERARLAQAALQAGQVTKKEEAA